MTTAIGKHEMDLIGLKHGVIPRRQQLMNDIVKDQNHETITKQSKIDREESEIERVKQELKKKLKENQEAEEREIFLKNQLEEMKDEFGIIT